MVLTRSAARAQNSITRWLPNEILAAVISETSRSDLVALCRTSRLIRNIATPLLYRVVRLLNGAQIEAFFRTIKSPAASSLSPLVRELRITDSELDLPLSPLLAEDITLALFQFSRLECLYLLLKETFEFVDILERGYFPKLSFFRYTIKPSSSPALLLDFIRRHPTITHLTLVQMNPFHQSNHIESPAFTGHIAFIAFVLWRGVISVSLSWIPTDPDIITEGSTTSPAVTVLVIEPLESTVLAGVVIHLPHASSVEIIRMDNMAYISREEAIEIAAHLKTLNSLTAFALRGPVDDNMPPPERDEDEETVATWSAACKTLSTLEFHAKEWERVEGRWVIVDPV
ncbi:hypothetical protein C8R45DRAFT_1113920 [Mycena sanguinolenta]|nr:hypothetical protein C8R45DRAFT_1113920 [Mycena sanguinolenta]